MAQQHKKRSRSASPSHSGASPKRTRQMSLSNSSMGYPSTQATAEDWRFRLRIISSAVEQDEVVFVEAVRGLVHICFPDGVLDELGIDIIHAHMREQKAPSKNIARMENIFASIMIQRASELLARYLDTPGKLDTAISTLKDATHRLYGTDVVDKGANDSPGNMETTVNRASEANDSNDQENNPHEEELAQKRATKSKTKPSREPHERAGPPDLAEPDEFEAERTQSQIELASCVSELTTNDKAKRVSRGWRWNVDPKTIGSEDISTSFKRASDLFAYHSLPSIQSELGPSVKRKAIRKKIEALLVLMSDEQYEGWVISFQKLCQGDMTMLERTALSDISDKVDVRCVIPTPVSRKHRREVQFAVYDDSALHQEEAAVNNGASEVVADTSHTVGGFDINMKQETAADSGLANVSAREAPAPAPPSRGHAFVSAFGSPSGEIGGTTMRTHYGPVRARHTKCLQQAQSISNTPIVDFLCPEHFQERHSRTETVIRNLMKRVSVHSIKISQPFYIESEFQTKDQLRDDLFGIDSNQVYSHRQRKQLMEFKLCHWLIANVDCFPELANPLIVFISLMPNKPFVCEIFKDSERLKPFKGITKQGSYFRRALQCRGYPPVSGHGPSLKKIISIVGNDTKQPYPLPIKLMIRENILRRAAYAHRDNFPELRSSLLVKEWEHISGQRW